VSRQERREEGGVRIPATIDKIFGSSALEGGAPQRDEAFAAASAYAADKDLATEPLRTHAAVAVVGEIVPEQLVRLLGPGR
jgi:hypothetical protein